MATPGLRRYLDTTAQVSDHVFDARLKLIMRNFVHGSREMPNQFQDLILWIDMQGLEIWRPEERVKLPLIDDIWGSERFTRDFLSMAPSEEPEKVKWLALYFKLKHPELNRHLLRRCVPVLSPNKAAAFPPTSVGRIR